jgi:hypothetical protein
LEAHVAAGEKPHRAVRQCQSRAARLADECLSAIGSIRSVACCQMADRTWESIKTGRAGRFGDGRITRLAEVCASSSPALNDRHQANGVAGRFVGLMPFSHATLPVDSAITFRLIKG